MTKLDRALVATASVLALSSPFFTDYDNHRNISDLLPKSIVGDYQDQELLDDNGNKYILHKNADDSETARYENGKEVTFKRDEQGNIIRLSGDSNLLPSLLMSYLIFSGLSSSGGTWSSAGNYVSKAPMKPINQEVRNFNMQKYTPAGGKIQDITPPKTNVSGRSSTSGGAKSSVGSVKSGFGSAGARSAAS